jgi:hypothetical protein
LAMLKNHPLLGWPLAMTGTWKQLTSLGLCSTLLPNSWRLAMATVQWNLYFLPASSFLIAYPLSTAAYSFRKAALCWKNLREGVLCPSSPQGESQDNLCVIHADPHQADTLKPRPAFQRPSLSICLELHLTYTMPPYSPSMMQPHTPSTSTQ